MMTTRRSGLTAKNGTTILVGRGAAQQVDYNIEVDLVKGANIVVYRCGESGGHAYMNLHFDDKTHAAVDIYPDKAKDQKSFFNEVKSVLAVDPVGKLANNVGGP